MKIKSNFNYNSKAGALLSVPSNKINRTKSIHIWKPEAFVPALEYKYF